MNVDPSHKVSPLEDSGCLKPGRKQLQEKVNQSNKEVQKMSLLIQQEREKLKNLKNEVRSEDLGVITRRQRIKQYCEKLMYVYMEMFDRSCSTQFPDDMLTDLDELTSNLMKNMSCETHVDRLKLVLSRKVRKERMAREARRERRTFEEMLTAFAPPPFKICGRILLPPIQPPMKEKVEKKEPVKPKNQ